MNLPETMRVVVTSGAGGPDVMRIGDSKPPTPRADEVLIRVQAAGVNRPDLAQRAGTYPPPPDASPVLGLEVAGVVVATGSAVTRLKMGDKVCALVNGGGYAEYCTAPEAQCLPWPAGFDALRAAALPETFFTVWANVFGHGALKPGESLLVHGGASGIGTVAIQLAKAVGATVYATAGSAEKCAMCEKLGASAAINYRTQDFVAEIGRLTQGRGVDVILDMVAGPYLSRNTQSLARDGRLVVIAVQGGTRDPNLDIRLVMMRRLVITGSTMRPRSTAEKGAIAEALRAHAWPLLEAGTVAPVIFATFPFEQVVEAHKTLEQGDHAGKVMLTFPG